MYSIDIKTGNINWHKKLNWNVIPPLNNGLLTYKNVVYAGSGMALCAIDTESGKVLWENNSWKTGEGCNATLSTDGSVLIGGANWRAMYANDTSTGKLLWENSDLGLKYISSSPVMIDNLAYVLAGNSFFKIDSKTGNILSYKKLKCNVEVTSSPLILSDIIIFGTADSGLVALDPKTYEKKWSYKTGPSLIHTVPYSKYPDCSIETSPIISGNAVYFSASDGVIYALEINTGSLLWKYETGISCLSTVVASGNALYVTDFGGNIYCFISSKEK